MCETRKNAICMEFHYPGQIRRPVAVFCLFFSVVIRSRARHRKPQSRATAILSPRIWPWIILTATAPVTSPPSDWCQIRFSRCNINLCEWLCSDGNCFRGNCILLVQTFYAVHNTIGQILEICTKMDFVCTLKPIMETSDNTIILMYK